MDKTLEIELTEIMPKVLATALRFFRASRLDGDPEDVVQDVLLRLWVARRDGVQIRSAEACGKTWSVLEGGSNGFEKETLSRVKKNDCTQVRSGLCVSNSLQ